MILLCSNYRCIISRISKSETINLTQNIELTEKTWNTIKHKNLLSRIKMDKEIQTFADIEIEKKKKKKERKNYCNKILSFQKMYILRKY